MRASTSGCFAAGDARRHAAPARQLRRLNLRHHAARAQARHRAARQRPRLVVDVLDPLDQAGVLVLARIGGEQPRLIGQQDQQVSFDQRGDQRREVVVVADADFVGGDGVVLVDDRDDVACRSASAGCRGR